MGRPTVFTAPVQKKILDVLTVGASRQTAAAVAGIGISTLNDWLSEGKSAEPGTAKAKFLHEVEAAEGGYRHRALAIVHREMENNPTLAWKVVERREPGFAAPVPNARPVQTGPVVIQLALHDGSRPALPPAEVIEGEVVGESDQSA